MNAYTKKRLCELKLADLAKAIELQEMDLSAGKLNFDERLEQILAVLIQDRQNSMIKRLIKNSRMKYPEASVDTLDCKARKIDRKAFLHIAKLGFVESTTNIIVAGPSGSGKTYLACSLGVEACKQGFRTFYIRTSDLIRNFENQRDNLRELKRYQRRISNYPVLILDEWLSHKLSDREAKWIYELMEMRSGNHPTIFVGQFPADAWHERLGGGTLADSIMDRIIHNSYPFASSETNLRKIYDEQKLKKLLDSFKD
ncbi:MAG: ATP-binding protein [Oribacterium sp.]|nr:ATP-binding protein [Oribacterium sp.]